MNFTDLLFETQALKICPVDKPFWYTSGMLGPYYINTHFLYGSESKAKILLSVIDNLKTNPATCAEKLTVILMENYTTEPVFKAAVDGLIHKLRQHCPDDSYDCISGGERRDWIFSLPVAKLLGKPHLTLFKDGTLTHNQISNFKFQISGAPAVVHIADLLNTASSYERAWIPQLRKNDYRMLASLVVVDRSQGGGEYLQSEAIENLACVTIEPDFFKEAAARNHISRGQLDMILSYMADPGQYMKSFLAANPGYLDTAKDISLSQSVLSKL